MVKMLSKNKISRLFSKGGRSIAVRTNTGHVSYSRPWRGFDFDNISEQLFVLLDKIKSPKDLYTFFLHHPPEMNPSSMDFSVEMMGKRIIKIIFWKSEISAKFAGSLSCGKIKESDFEKIFLELKALQNNTKQNNAEVKAPEVLPDTVLDSIDSELALEKETLIKSEVKKKSLDDFMEMDILDVMSEIRKLPKNHEMFIFYSLLAQDVSGRNCSIRDNHISKNSVLANNKDRKKKYEKLLDAFLTRFATIFEGSDKVYIFYDQAIKFLTSPDDFDRSILDEKESMLLEDVRLKLSHCYVKKKNTWSVESEKKFQDSLAVPFLKERADEFRDLFFKTGHKELMQAQQVKDVAQAAELKLLMRDAAFLKNILATHTAHTKTLKDIFESSSRSESITKRKVADLASKIIILERQLKDR